MRSFDYDENQIPRSYDAGRAFEASAMEVWVSDLRERVGDVPRRALDVGCGTGRFTLVLQSAFPRPTRSVGVDASRLMLQQAGAKPDLARVPLTRGRAEALPFADGSFDLVVFSMVIHQLDSVAAAMGEVHRVLTPGGKLYVRTPTQESFRGCQWAAAFPRAADIGRRVLPERARVLEEVCAQGFRATSSGPVRFVVAATPEAFLRKVGRRAISSHRELTDAEFEAGMDKLGSELRRLDADQAVEEDVDAFCFEAE